MKREREGERFFGHGLRDLYILDGNITPSIKVDRWVFEYC
jgi:hypothetical protein